jgi:hypothetical protein
MYNATLRRVHETTVTRKSNKYYIFLSVRVRVSACECVRACVCARAWACACARVALLRHAHAPYGLRPLWLHQIFRHYIMNATIFVKVLNIKCVFWFYLQLLFEKFLILRGSY